MNREWFTAQDLAGLPGLPTTARRVRERAKKEQWKARRRAGRGGGHEYHIDSLPKATKVDLILRESPADSSSAGEPGHPSQADGRSSLAAPGAAASSQGEAAAPFDVEGAKEHFEKNANENDRAEAWERLQLLDKVHAMTDLGLSKREACKRAGVPFQTYYNWMKLVRGHDHENWLELLCPAPRGGNNRTEWSREAKNFLKEHWLDRRQPSMRNSIRRTQEAAKLEGWELPSERTMMRYLENLPHELVRRMREGRETTAEMIVSQRRSVLGLGAGEWVNGDGLKLDELWIEFPDGEIVNGATLWCNQDIRTRYFFNCRLGKTETGDLFRLSMFDLTEFCLPKYYVVDNTTAAANKMMTAAQSGRRRFKNDPEDGQGLLAMLGTEVVFTDPDKLTGRPGAKPIERAYREFQSEIVTNPKLKGRGRSKATAVPAALVEEVVEFERRRWNARPARETEACRGVLSFNQAWQEAVAEKAPRRCDPRRRRLLLFSREVVYVNKRDAHVRLKAGATTEWGAHRYICDGLSRFRGQKLVALYDPTDLTKDIYLYSLQGRFLFAAQDVPNVAFNSKEAAGQFRKLKIRKNKSFKAIEEAEMGMNQARMQDIYDKVPAPDGPDGSAAGNVEEVDFKPVPDPERDRRVAGSDVDPEGAGLDEDYERFSRTVRRLKPE